MLSNHASRVSTPAFTSVAPGVFGLRRVFANLYFVATGPAQARFPWVLVDSGLAGSAAAIRRHATEVFGRENPPVAIVLTHGHFDHAGGLPELLRAWPNVPIYAHALELPYLTGRCRYPAPDPAAGGGLLAWLSFLYPRHPYNLGMRVHPLPADGSVPGLPGWRWLPTPGHTPGHVSLFRDADKVLLAGDAFTTVAAESALATLTQRQQVHGPPAYFTPDWEAARDSVRRLADLAPEVAATGHGIAMHGEPLRRQLRTLGEYFDQLARPRTGRYARPPAVADTSGDYLTPRPQARLLVTGLALAGTVLAALGLLGARKARRGRKRGKKAPAGHRAATA